MGWPQAVWTRDLVVATIATVVAQIELVLVAGSVPAGWFLTNLLILPALALRRVRPLPAALVAAGGFALQLLDMESLPVAVPFLALLFLMASVGWYATLGHGLLALAAVLVGGLVPEVVRGSGAGDLLVNAVILGGTWSGGHLLRRSSDRRILAEVAADRAARDAVETERARIARDLHDSMAHALTLITLQSGSARERSDEPRIRELLAGIEVTGREALEDMHRLLRLVGGEDEGMRGVAALEDLVAEARRSGDLEVDLEVDLPEDIPATLATTVFRVVQEGLTNVLRHSDARSARVGVSPVDEDTVLVEVTDTGRSRPAAVTGTGRGLAGLRERVTLLGGVLESGPAPAGWRLTARLPWRSR